MKLKMCLPQNNGLCSNLSINNLLAGVESWNVAYRKGIKILFH